MPAIRSNVRDCAVLNGLIFLGSLLLFHFAVHPLLELILSYAFNASAPEFTLRHAWYCEAC